MSRVFAILAVVACCAVTALPAVLPERPAQRSDLFAVFREGLLDSGSASSFPECSVVPAVSLDR